MKKSFLRAFLALLTAICLFAPEAALGSAGAYDIQVLPAPDGPRLQLAAGDTNINVGGAALFEVHADNLLITPYPAPQAFVFTQAMIEANQLQVEATYSGMHFTEPQLKVVGGRLYISATAKASGTRVFLCVAVKDRFGKVSRSNYRSDTSMSPGMYFSIQAADSPATGDNSNDDSGSADSNAGNNSSGADSSDSDSNGNDDSIGNSSADNSGNGDNNSSTDADNSDSGGNGNSSGNAGDGGGNSAAQPDTTAGLRITGFHGGFSLQQSADAALGAGPAARPGSSLFIPLKAGAFAWSGPGGSITPAANAHVTAAQLSEAGASVYLSGESTPGCCALQGFADTDDGAAIQISVHRPFLSTEDIPFRFSLCLDINNASQTAEVSGLVLVDVMDASPDVREYDLSGGSVLYAPAAVREARLFLGASVTLRCGLASGSRYCGIAQTEQPAAGTLGGIHTAYSLCTRNLSHGEVQIDTGDTLFYMYDQNLMYLGTSREWLPYRDIYFASAAAPVRPPANAGTYTGASSSGGNGGVTQEGPAYFWEENLPRPVYTGNFTDNPNTGR